MRKIIYLLTAIVTALGLYVYLAPLKTPSDQSEWTATQSPPETTSFSLIEATISDLHAALKADVTSCEDVVQGYLNRIDAYDQSSGLNAITVKNPEALTRAKDIDNRLKQNQNLGSLYCVPVLAKDNFDTHDMITSGGSLALKTSYPPDDAFMVKKLRDADAIIIAKTNMAEWAFSPRESISSSFGQTANAYDLTRTPAGSSGGTASGVAANFALVGLGSDTGNSIRGPASHLALVGIRSTIGLTSRDGVIPLSFDRDIAGPMTRTVEDNARLFQVIAGYDPKDPYTEAVKDMPLPNYLEALKRANLEGKRIGVLKALVDREDADPEIQEIFYKSLEILSDLGAEIVDPITVPNWEVHMEGENYFCRRFRYDMAQYLKSLGPDAPISDVNQVLETGQYHPSAKGGVEFFSSYPADVHPKDWEKPCPDYINHAGRQAFKADVQTVMDQEDLDVLIYPSWSNPPAPLETAREDYKGDNSQRVAPATGLPAITVPMGWYQDKWPTGLQILARAFDEESLFEIAYAYEQATLHRRPPAQFGPLKN